MRVFLSFFLLTSLTCVALSGFVTFVNAMKALAFADQKVDKYVTDCARIINSIDSLR